MSVQEIIESLKQQETIKALKAKGLIGEIVKENQEALGNTIQAIKSVLSDKKYIPMQYLLSVKLCKDIIEQRPQRFIQVFQEEILSLILKIALFDPNNQSENKGYNYFSDNPDQNERMCGKSLVLLSLECIYNWAKWFPIDNNKQITEFKKASLKLEQNNIKIPKVFKYFKNENEPSSTINEKSKNLSQAESPQLQPQKSVRAKSLIQTQIPAGQTPEPDQISKDPVENAQRTLNEGAQLQKQLQLLCSSQQLPNEKLQTLLKDIQKYIDQSNHAMEQILEDDKNEKLFQELFEIQQWTEQVQQEYLKYRTSSGLNWQEFRKKYQSKDVFNVPEENGALHKKIKQLEAELQHSQQQINQKNDEIKNLESTIQKKENAELESLSLTNQLQQILEQQNQEIQKLKLNNSQSENELKQLQLKFNQLKVENDKFNKNNNNNDQEVILRQTIQALQNEEKQYKYKSEQELSKLQQHVDELLKKNQILEDKAKQTEIMKNQIENFERQLQENKIQLQDQQQLFQDLQDEHSNVKNEYMLMLNQEYQQLEEQKQQSVYDEQVKNFEEQIQKQKNVIDLQSARIEALENDVQKMDENNFLLQKKMNNMIYEQKYQSNLQSGQTKKEQSLAELNQTVKKLIQEKIELQNQNDQIMIQFVQIQDELSQVRLDFEGKEIENKSLQEKIIMLKNEVNFQLEQLKKFEQLLNGSQSSVSFQQLLEKYNQATQDRQKLQDELEQTQLDYQQNTDREMKIFNQQVDDLQEEINKLNIENSSLNKEIFDLKENLRKSSLHQSSTKRFNLSVLSPQGNNKNFKPNSGVEYSTLDKYSVQKSPSSQQIKKKNEFS